MNKKRIDLTLTEIISIHDYQYNLFNTSKVDDPCAKCSINNEEDGCLYWNGIGRIGTRWLNESIKLKEIK